MCIYICINMYIYRERAKGMLSHRVVFLLFFFVKPTPSRASWAS